MENVGTRSRLGSQLAAARREKSWTLEQVARRTGRAGPRLSEMESGKANSTIDTLEAVGRVLGLQLMFVPDSRMREVIALVNSCSPSSPRAYAVPSIFDEVFIDEGEDEDELGAGL